MSALPNAMSATKARDNFYQLIKQVNANHREVTVVAQKGNVVIVSEEDWRGMQETAYINSIPGLAEDIIAASKEPDSEFVGREEIGL